MWQRRGMGDGEGAYRRGGDGGTVPVCPARSLVFSLSQIREHTQGGSRVVHMRGRGGMSVFGWSRRACEQRQQQHTKGIEARKVPTARQRDEDQRHSGDQTQRDRARRHEEKHLCVCAG